jgi:uncharacterized membrane protein
MNTVFKFYLHIWLIFGLVAAFAVWYLLSVAWRPALPTLTSRLTVASAGTGFALLVLGALIYPIFATPVRLDDRFKDLPATLDGTAYMKDAVYDDQKGKIVLNDDYEGIQWMRQNVRGTPTIVEGRTDIYRWGSRFSIYTGLPTVLGWDWHQTQQRGEFAFLIEQRRTQVDAFYNNPDVLQAQNFLQQFDVRFVILGQVERLYYPGVGLEKFDSNLGGVLEVAYRNESLTIYRVKQSVLRARAAP